MTDLLTNRFAIFDTDSDSGSDSETESLCNYDACDQEIETNFILNSNSNLCKLESDIGHTSFKKNTRNKFRKSTYSNLLFDSNGVLDEVNGLPSTLNQAMKKKQNLTLKQITSIMNLHGLWGEMFNIIHDRIQLDVRRYKVKVTHQSRVFYVSLYYWYDLKKIKRIIESMLDV